LRKEKGYGAKSLSHTVWQLGPHVCVVA